jgi:methyl-accepting chemotaxis protein
MNFVYRSIRNQIVFWTGLCLLVSNAAGISFSIFSIKQQADQARVAATAAGKEKAAAIASDIADAYRDELNSALIVSRQMAQAFAAVSYASNGEVSTSIVPERETVSLMLQGILIGNPNLVGIYSDWEPDAFDHDDQNNIGNPNADLGGRFTVWWARPNGTEIEKQENDFTYEDEVLEDYYRLPMESGQETIVEPYIDMVGGKPCLMTSLIVPIMSGQTFLGIVGVDIAITDLQLRVDEMANTIYDGTTQIDIISNQGLVVAKSGDPDSAGKPYKEIYQEEWSDVYSSIQSGKSTLQNNDGEIRLFAPIQVGATNTPWTVILTLHQKVLTEQAEKNYDQAVRLLWLMIVFGILFTGFALVCLWKLAQAISWPIQLTAGFLSNVAKGDVSHDVHQVLMERRDEIGSLGSSTQSMMEGLRKIFTKLSRSVETLGISSLQLLSISEKTRDAASHSSRRANAIAMAAEEMSSSTLSVANSVEQVTQNLSSISSTIEEMTTTIVRIATSSEKARSATFEAVSQTNQTSILMDAMGGAVNQIGKVTETITAISKQTNILALNATIEAARAGQAGQGFAVVAKEIRELASQTADATHEIREQIASVQNTTSNVVYHIGNNLQVIKEVDNIVSSIVEAIQAYSTATQEIATNMARVSIGVNDANKKVNQTATTTQNIAAEIHEVSTVVFEMVRESELIQSSALELSKVADQLQQIMSQYKI